MYMGSDVYEEPVPEKKITYRRLTDESDARLTATYQDGQTIRYSPDTLPVRIGKHLYAKQDSLWAGWPLC